MQQGKKQLVLIKDHLGLVKEGQAIELPLYQILTLLDGTRTPRDIQMELMRQQRGMLVGMDEVERILSHLDDAYLLDSERYQKARDQIVSDFVSKKVRPCSHCGSAYPEDPSELKERLDEILALKASSPPQAGTIKALVAPHIDLSVGGKIYADAYQMLQHVAPSRVVLLGVGHHLVTHLFCLTDKDFETPLGGVRNDATLIQELKDAGGEAIADDDFAHRSEHAIEFQLIFLQHLLKEGSFEILPILCGQARASLQEYSRNAYRHRAEPFLNRLREILIEPDKDTLLIAGVDFSHIGPKFGHDMPARYLQGQSEAHDKNLLGHLCRLDADSFWEESKKVEDRFNVCGFSTLACLLEVLPPSRGEVLGYEQWHEEATRSAVSFSAVVFVS